MDKTATDLEFEWIFESYWRGIFRAWQIDVAMARICKISIREAYPLKIISR